MWHAQPEAVSSLSVAMHLSLEGSRSPRTRATRKRPRQLLGSAWPPSFVWPSAHPCSWTLLWTWAYLCTSALLGFWTSPWSSALLGFWMLLCFTWDLEPNGMPGLIHDPDLFHLHWVWLNSFGLKNTISHNPLSTSAQCLAWESKTC